MADVRSVVVRLSAETSSYVAKMQGAGKATEDAMGKSEKASHKASVGLTDVEKAGAAGAVALAGMALVASADFEQAMSSVEAATHGTAAEMASLEQAALDAGKATSFSATEAAAGIENLAKAGVSTADILGGALTGSLDLAAAGTISVADAAEYTATALTQFQLDGSQAAHVADLLAAGAGKAQGEVSDMALALNYAGVPAANLGVSIEETAGSIALLAKNGIVGEKAGTALRGMLGSIGSPSKAAAKEMENLGLRVFDAQGKFIGFEGVAGQLQARLAGLTQEEREQALGRIFGNEQAAAAGVFFREGAAGVAEMTAAVNDSGYAAETAAIKMDNLKGDVEVLMGSIETALIGSGDSSQDSLRSTTQLLTEMVDVMSEVQEQDAFGSAVDQLSVVNSDVFKLGLDNLKKTKDALFGVDDAATDAAAASEEKATADTTAASASADLSYEAGQSVEQIEAQAEALKDARDAATDTARGFVNLGDSLDDSKVSLGDWIKQMANQADALKNFRLNAEEAADKGLRKGLINSLQEAGTEGALRMKQLANATKGEIDKANAAWKSGQTEINKYVNATTKVPTKVSTKAEVDARLALASFRELDVWMDNIDGRRVNTYVNTAYTVTGKKGAAVFSQDPDRVNEAYGDVKDRHDPEIAEGGSWRVWAEPETMGESYIPHANDSRRPRAKAILEETASILGARSVEWYAGGGSTKKKRPGGGLGPADPMETDAQRARREKREEEAAQRQEQAQRDAAEALEAKRASDEYLAQLEEDRIRAEQERADAIFDGQQRAWDMATDAAKAQVDAAQQMVDSVKANMDRLGQAATAAFENTIFDKNSQQHGLWTGDNTAAGGWRGNLTNDITGLQERSGLIGQLSDPSLGLSATALEALLGQADNATIAAMLAAGEVDDYASLFKQREDLLGSVSTQAGMAGYGEEYAAASSQLVLTNQKLDLLNALIAQARPITVTETISAAALAAEVARLQAATGGY